LYINTLNGQRQRNLATQSTHGTGRFYRFITSSNGAQILNAELSTTS